MTDDPWRAPDPWRPPEPWATPPEAWTQPAEQERVLRWPGDAVSAGVTAVFVALAGSVAGLVWGALAPQFSVRDYAAGSQGPFKAQVGADAWFLLVSVAAGVLCATIALLAFRDRGPGILIGLAVGGVAAAFIADGVGYLQERDNLLSALHTLGLQASPEGISLLEFKVRALGVAMGWPIAAVVVYGLSALLGRHRR